MCVITLTSRYFILNFRPNGRGGREGSASGISDILPKGGRLDGRGLAGDSDEERDARLDGRAGSSSVGNVCHIAGENCPVRVDR